MTDGPHPTAAEGRPIPPKIKQLQVNGTSLAYYERGEGDPMILVHGGVSDLRTWNVIEDRLAARFRVIVYSRRYAWPNPPNDEVQNDLWQQDIDDLEAIINALGLSPVHLVGNSAGAYLGLLLAHRKPKLFRSLVLEEPPVMSIFSLSTPPTLMQVISFLWNYPWDFFPIMKFGIMVMGPAISALKRGNHAASIDIFGKGVLGTDIYNKITDERREQMLQNLPLAFLLKNVLPPFSEDDARSLTVPTLFLSGENTPNYQRPITRRLLALIPGAQEKVISNASHFMHEDNPDGTFEAIFEYTEAICRG